MYFQDKRERFSQGNLVQDKKQGLWKAVDFTSGYFLTFGSLVICAALFELIGLALKTPSFEGAVLPENFLQGIFCAFTLAAASFYEECLYRLYLPKALKKILGRIKAGEKAMAALNFLAEGAAVLLFAFAHRYQGILALFNALLAGVILRLAFVKTKSLWPPYLAHLSFNAAALLFYANVNPIQ
ncbi:MAG: CPBP family intramembrane metalloprotease [Treponema sp.]|nr:CPBP family intramembrane metalloprotease [Treponema sp.]